MNEIVKCERCREYNAAAVDFRHQATNAQNDYAALLARHNALRDAVAWDRECDGMLWPIYGTDAYFEVYNTKVAARAEVDRLVGEG